MIYVYKCPNCKMITEVEHSMSECDNPSIKTQLSTSCNENTCQDVEHSCLGAAWQRIPQAPQLNIKGAYLDPHKREKFKQKAHERSFKDFYQNTWSKLDDHERNHHRQQNPDKTLKD